MQNRFLLLITAVLSVVYFVIPESRSSSNTTFLYPEKEETIIKEEPKQLTINLKKNNNEIDTIELEEYIVGVVAGEMPASFHEEALKAQAVAARTYALYKKSISEKNYDILGNANDQCYSTIEDMQKRWGSEFNKYYEKIKKAVNDTKGQVMYYNDEIIIAFYFAMSNGYTEDAKTVFNNDLEYLQSTPSTYDNEKIKDFKVSKKYNKQTFCNKLNIKCNEIKITNIVRRETGYIDKITINNKVFSGSEIRNLLALRSTDFTIKINKDNIEITTKGYGHGVGMSQYGANGMAEQGYTYEEILNYYYKNIKISEIIV